ncbi:MAG: YhbY family RNA-binding protein [Ruminococcaceae bacterium]|nr:YhbY family RNA-binding protein [Oscillospiraceae bacterium]
MLTGKQRAQLRAMANAVDTIIIIGKGGITDAVVNSVEDALRARELVKGKVLENSLLTSKEAVNELARLCKAEPVQAIGSKFVLYKENKGIDVEKRIKLVR